MWFYAKKNELSFLTKFYLMIFQADVAILASSSWAVSCAIFFLFFFFAKNKIESNNEFNEYFWTQALSDVEREIYRNKAKNPSESGSVNDSISGRSNRSDPSTQLREAKQARMVEENRVIDRINNMMKCTTMNKSMMNFYRNNYLKNWPFHRVSLFFVFQQRT